VVLVGILQMGSELSRAVAYAPCHSGMERQWTSVVT
jgi:hypothetical protein